MVLVEVFVGGEEHREAVRGAVVLILVTGLAG